MISTSWFVCDIDSIEFREPNNFQITFSSKMLFFCFIYYRIRFRTNQYLFYRHWYRFSQTDLDSPNSNEPVWGIILLDFSYQWIQLFYSETLERWNSHFWVRYHKKEPFMYHSHSDPLPPAYLKKTRSFIEYEVKNFLAEHGCSSFDRDSLKELITVWYLNCSRD